MITNGFTKERLKRSILERLLERLERAEVMFLDDPVGRIYRVDDEYILTLGDVQRPYMVRKFSTFGLAFTFLDSIDRW